MWDDNIYPFPNFNDVTVEGWEWLCNFNSNATGLVITYIRLGVSMDDIVMDKLIDDSKRSPRE